MSTVSSIPGYMTAYEVADILEVDHSQVCRYCADEKLPAIKVGNQWMIKENDARNFQKPPVGNPAFQRKR